MSKADKLRVPDYLKHILEAIQDVGWAEVRSPTDPKFQRLCFEGRLGLLGFAVKPLSPTYDF